MLEPRGVNVLPSLRLLVPRGVDVPPSLRASNRAASDRTYAEDEALAPVSRFVAAMT